MKPLLSNHRAVRTYNMLLALLPFAGLLLIYAVYFYRGAPIPGLSELVSRFAVLAGDWQTGHFWRDATHTFVRLLMVTSLSVLLALIFAVSAYCYALLRAIFTTFFRVWAFVPLFFFLPILATSENLTSLVNGVLLAALIPLLTVRIARYLDQLPEMQRVKAKTLHANTWLYMLRIMLPQAIAFQWYDTQKVLPLILLLVLTTEALAGVNGIGLSVMQAIDDKSVVFIYLGLTTATLYIAIAVLQRLGQYFFPWFQGEQR